MMARLGDVCIISAGQGAPQGDNNYCDYRQGIPFVKAGDLSDLLLGKPEKDLQCVNDEVAKKYKLKLYPSGSILFAKSGMSCMKGYIYRTQSPCYVVSHLAIAIPEKVNGEYLKFYFQYHKPNSLIKDPAYPSISLQDISNIELNIPSKDEQKDIAANLNKISNLITLHKQQLSKLNELIKARFVELFGDLKTNPHNWQCLSFLNVAEIDTTMVTDYEKYADYPHIGIDSIEKNTGRLFGYRTIAEDGVISGKYLFTPKHIIYSKIRPNLNKVALPDFEGLCSADAYPILPKENVCLRIYLGYVLRSEFFLDYILPFSRRANMPKVNKEQLSGFVLPVPDIDLQKQFAAFVEQVDKSKFAVQNSLEKLETLKKALMQQYFG